MIRLAERAHAVIATAIAMIAVVVAAPTPLIRRDRARRASFRVFLFEPVGDA